MTKKQKDIIVVIALVSALIIVLAVVIFIGVPQLAKTVPGNEKATPTPAATSAIPTPVTPSRTIPAPTPVPMTPEPVVTTDERYAESYKQVFTNSKAYKFGEKVTFPYLLTNPPLYIKFEVTPAMVNDTKMVGIDTSAEREVYAVYPSPLAWFEVKILDPSSGAVIDSQGFGSTKGYSVVTKQDFMVRRSGNYTIELSGNQVTATTEILVGAG